MIRILTRRSEEGLSAKKQYYQRKRRMHRNVDQDTRAFVRYEKRKIEYKKKKNRGKPN